GIDFGQALPTHDANVAFLNAAYLQILGRLPGPGDQPAITGYLFQLSDPSVVPPQELVVIDVAGERQRVAVESPFSQEYLADKVNSPSRLGLFNFATFGYYQSLLGRNAGASEQVSVTLFAQMLQSGSKDQDIIALIASSGEFYNHAQLYS